MKVGSFTPLADIFPSIAQKHKVQSQVMEAYACHVCNQILKKIMKKQGKTSNARAIELKNGKLYITVSTSTIAQEIALHKMEILVTLHDKGYEVHTIKTTVGTP